MAIFFFSHYLDCLGGASTLLLCFDLTEWNNI